LIAQELEQIEKDLSQINIDVQLVTDVSCEEQFKSEVEIDKFLHGKSYLDAKKSSKQSSFKKSYFVFKDKEFKSFEEAQKAGAKKSKIQKKEKEVQEIIFTANWTQKAVNYNNFFSLKLSVIDDLISQNKAKNEFFFIDDIDRVIRDRYNQNLEVVTKNNDLIKPFKESDNTLYKRVLAWVDQGNKIKDKIYSVDDVLKVIKNETNKRIRTINGRLLSNNEWLQKSQNYQDIKTTYLAQQVLKSLGQENTSNDAIPKKDYDFATKIIDRKDAFVRHYRTVLKPKIYKMSSTELQSFDPFDKNHWEGLEC
jgi:hypothetical protein